MSSPSPCCCPRSLSLRLSAADGYSEVVSRGQLASMPILGAGGKCSSHLKRRMDVRHGGRNTLAYRRRAQRSRILSLVDRNPLAGAVVGLVTLLSSSTYEPCARQSASTRRLAAHDADSGDHSFGLITRGGSRRKLVVNALCGFLPPAPTCFYLIIRGLHFALALLQDALHRDGVAVVLWAHCHARSHCRNAQGGHGASVVHSLVGRLADGRRKSARNLPIGPVEDVRTRGSDSK